MPEGARADLQREVADDLRRMATLYPFFKAKHIESLAAINVAHLADAPRPARAVAAQVAFWLIAFDELVDEEGLPAETLRALAGDLSATVAWSAARLLGGDRRAPEPAALGRARAAPATPATQALLALAAINHQIVAFQPSPPLVETWVTAFDRMARATIEQRELGRQVERLAWLARDGQPGEAATIERVLPLLRHSVGVPYYLAIGLIIANDAGLVDRLPRLQPIIDASATAIRLANDLRSWRKDEDESNMNTIVALTMDVAQRNPGWPRERCRAVALVEAGQRLEAAVAATRRLIAASPCPAGVWERRVERMVTVTTAWYRAATRCGDDARQGAPALPLAGSPGLG